MRSNKTQKLAVAALLSISTLVITILVWGFESQETPPEITFDIDFPQEILVDGEKVQSFVFFRDRDGDIAEIQFEIPEIGEFLRFDPQAKGLISGVIPFSIAMCSSPLELQVCVEDVEECKSIKLPDSIFPEIELAITLADEAGHESEPKKLVFEVGGLAEVGLHPSTEAVPSLSLLYDHALFVENPDIGETWSTGSINALSRWSFWPKGEYVWQGEPEVWPLTLVVKSDVPIDLSVYHTEPVVATPPEYKWELMKEVTFSMGPRVRVDPGLMVIRSVSPTELPPGESEIEVEASLTLQREPTIEGEPLGVEHVGLGLFVARDQFFKRWIEVLDIIPISSCHDSFISDYWENTGCVSSFTAEQVRKGVSCKFRIRVNNRSTQTLRFLPTVSVNLYGSGGTFSHKSGTKTASDHLVLDLRGPVGEELPVTLRANKADQKADWEYDVQEGQGAIWLWWRGYSWFD